MTYRNSAAIAAFSAVLFAAPAYAGSHMEGEKADMSKKDVFMKIDANSDSKLTFTEFADFSEAHGVSSSDAAMEFTRLAGEQTTINMEGFEELDMKAYKGHKKDKMKSSMKDKGMKDKEAKMSAPESMNQSASASAETSAMMNAEYGDFAKLDSDSDGSVSFKEYHKMRKSQGVTSTTQVAQEFTRLSGGEAMLSADQYQMAKANDVLNRPSYRAQTNSQVRGSVISNMKEAETVDLPIDNNPAGLNQMNSSELESNMTNSGADTDLEKSSNPQMEVWGDK
ncbi:hypothetical protein [Litorimonas haliclonae]|uniref:hypothetical protein n=1 Tax=Litorimonas haliclonae TaxID=2081977 RepID=UPI0039F0724C